MICRRSQLLSPEWLTSCNLHLSQFCTAYSRNSSKCIGNVKVFSSLQGEWTVGNGVLTRQRNRFRAARRRATVRVNVDDGSAVVC